MNKQIAGKLWIIRPEDFSYPFPGGPKQGHNSLVGFDEEFKMFFLWWKVDAMHNIITRTGDDICDATLLPNICDKNNDIKYSRKNDIAGFAKYLPQQILQEITILKLEKI